MRLGRGGQPREHGGGGLAQRLFFFSCEMCGQCIRAVRSDPTAVDKVRIDLGVVGRICKIG